MSERRRQRAEAAAAVASVAPETFPPFALADWFRVDEPIPEQGPYDAPQVDLEEWRFSIRAAAARHRYTAARDAHRRAAGAPADATAVRRPKIIGGLEQPGGRA